MLMVFAGLLGGRATAGDGNCDGDCDVDLTDFASFQLCFTGPDGTATVECECSDLDDDGDVDLTDFNEFQLAYTGPLGSTGSASVELVGNSLIEYPHFEFVRAYNEGAGAELAIDPSRHPQLVGMTCDMYVVEARTLAEWDADVDLVDVRGGGPQSITVSPGSITDNTFIISKSHLLSGEAGIDIGHGYDVVLDCDGDGLLGCSDVIDGLSDEAGMYVVHDLTQLGPLATTGLSSTMQLLTGQTIQHRLYYPSNIASMGEIPLVLIGHGFGHDWPWYDYLQEHLASYGYIAISHQQDFTLGPGVQRVLHVADAVLENQDVIAGGVLDGHVDANNISFIGHSRGGEEVVFAADTLFDGLYVPTHYTSDSIRFISGIGQTTALGPDRGNPHDFTFHVLYGAADGDVDGEPDCHLCQPFQHLDRATGIKLSTYVHGADHNDFNCCGFDNFDGPAGTAIGRPEAQRVAKAMYLAAHKHFFEGNIPAKDFLWRQYESIRPIGVDPKVTLVNTYHESPDTGKRVIDDFQTNPAPDQSSSGGSVFFTVNNLFENRLDDGDSVFTWLTSDPMNGMTYGGPQDTTRGVVFDYTVGEEPMIVFGVIPSDRDFSEFKYLSFRACQGTRHPETIAELADLTFTVALVDGSGGESAINFGAYEGGLEEPYQRSGGGTGLGVGWQNEFETIRIRLTDFLTDGSGLDLSDITEIRLDFGASFGSSRGRVGLDDVELTLD
jgi:hypothetical protein